MKESDFIEQNKEKWKNFERNLIKKDATPQEISKLFVQITDDLSYARTFYGKRSVKIYLNGVAKLLFNDINKAKKNKWSAFSNFWKKELPLVMYASRRAMLISFLVFVLCFTLGVITSIYDHDFARTILGDSYVSMTNKNIADGHPMHVYADDGEMETFLPILLNNLLVAFRTFFLGVFASIGSLVIMMYNGIMVGVFQFFFVEQDVLMNLVRSDGVFMGSFRYFVLEKSLFRQSFLAIWTHGTLEISAIIIAGGAGITLGKGLLFPRTYSRIQAFKISGRNGLKIIMGVSPVILLAAFCEGFLTRHTDIPDIIRFSFILLSLAFILIYFFWYPRKVAKNTPDYEKLTEPPPVYAKKTPFNINEILSTGRLFSETLRIFFKNIGAYFLLIFASSVLFATITSTDKLNLFFSPGNYYIDYNLIDFFNYSELPFMATLSGLLFIGILIFSILYSKHKLTSQHGNKFRFKNYSLNHVGISCLLSTSIFVGLIATGSGWFSFLAFLMLPFLLLISNISAIEHLHFFAAVSRTSSLLAKNWLRFFALSLVFLVMSWLFFAAVKFIFDDFLIKTGVLWVLTNSDYLSQTLSVGISSFIICFTFLTFLALLVSFFSVFYFTLKETYTAENLLSRIKNIKVRP